MTSTTFQTSALASVIKNRLFCPFDEYRALLSHMVGYELALWEVSSARWGCAQYLIKKFPELKKLPGVPEKVDSGSVKKYMRASVKTIGGADEYEINLGCVKFAQLSASEALTKLRAN